MIGDISVGSLVGEGFALGMIVWFTVWALTIPIRWFLRAIGMTDNYG